jgi:hypothetical protein
MTEEEWLACDDPRQMLDFLREKASERKLRLVGCAWCRHIWHLLADQRSRTSVEIAEQFADGDASEGDLVSAAAVSWSVSDRYMLGRKAAAAEAAAEAAYIPDEYGSDYHLSLLSYNAFYAAGETSSEYATQCQLLRDIFGNPFRPVAFDPAWRTSTAVALAEQMYASRDFGAMPILADALQDAGCDNADVLGHCRAPGEHVRGCWVVDLVLGKE